MTRKKLKSRLTLSVLILALLIGVALVSKLEDGNTILSKLYDFIKDTSLLVATIAVAYFANIFQQRQQFLQSLREQWREIVNTKAALTSYFYRESPSVDNYIAAQRQLSECIDNMRIVYANVGETSELIGLYPFAPLHQMRLVLERLDPSRDAVFDQTARKQAQQEIREAFDAIREHFLDEFDIEEPSRPVLIYSMKRMKKSGATQIARKLHDDQKAQVQAAGHPGVELEPAKF